ncbi:ABC transporter permease [Flavisolibacter nicotianae]|uniref:ABC transporter permease n=1 Tax=Flavisolibacter nicotianae TaxID=2364882 RepID=UPI000EB1F419|nr:ABC transporter permease [Flavisolibacter nicotianae]
MLKNFFTVAWRNLAKHKIFSFINIIGLASGLACFILIAMYVADELSYDRFNEKADRIYRVNSDVLFGGNNLRLAVCSDPMGATLKKDYPQVEEFVRFYNSDGYRMVKKGNEYLRENNVARADSTLFNVFTLPAIAGNTKTALNEPNTVVLTESTAKKYFGTTDVVGKQIETDENRSTIYKVTAVIKDIPHNSHFQFDFIFPMKGIDYQMGNFLSHNFQTYILLRPGTDYRAFEKNFNQVIDRYVIPQAKEFMNIGSMDEFRKAGNNLSYSLMPLTKIHLYSDRFPELGVNGNIQYVYIFSAVAIFVLLLACINFMNLSTARSAGRAREVGIRKVLGSEKRSLIQQFLLESIVTSFLATALAIGIAAVCLPWFNELSGKQLSLADFFQSKQVVFLVLLPLIVGLLAGAYPAFLLSSFRPIAVLKGRLNAGFRRSNLRGALVVFQFTTSIILIIGTIVVYRQLNYVQTKQLGFNKDQVLIVNGTGALREQATAFKQEVAKLSGVSGAAFAGYLPVEGSARNDNTFSTEAVMTAKNGFNMQAWQVDYDYLNLMGMQLVKGRNFSRDFGADSSAVIINETTAKLIGFDNPIGKKLYSNFQDITGNRLIAYDIIGVVKDFHFESLRQNIGPLCMRLGNPSWVTAFKVQTGNLKSLLGTIEKKWKAMAPGMPFSYQFLDDAFNSMYKVEQRTGKLGLSLAVIAILIACLGLLGLAMFTAEQRIKEIGIRKVLGATVTNLVSMLSKDFLKLVLLAPVIAFPVSWWIMNKWLQDFAYRTAIGWWIFALAAIMAVVIALLTVGSQAIRAALANPVKNLRTE